MYKRDQGKQNVIFILLFSFGSLKLYLQDAVSAKYKRKERYIMHIDLRIYEDLSIAYAQARLARKQDDAEKLPSTDELSDFVSDYIFARRNIAAEMKPFLKD